MCIYIFLFCDYTKYLEIIYKWNTTRMRRLKCPIWILQMLLSRGWVEKSIEFATGF